ncbi:unnamed protein product, partial [Polarella glacialis]
EQLDRLQDLIKALREAGEAQAAAVALATKAHTRLATVSGGEAGVLAGAATAEQPRVELLAALRRQNEVLGEAPSLHYDLLLAAAERELDDSEAMQDALTSLEGLHHRLRDAKQRVTTLEATQKRLRDGSGAAPSALGKLFGQKDRDVQMQDVAEQLSKSSEEAQSAEVWYAAARIVTIGSELDAAVAEKVALHRWLRDQIALRSRGTALRLAAVWEALAPPA